MHGPFPIGSTLYFWTPLLLSLTSLSRCIGVTCWEATAAPFDYLEDSFNHTGRRRRPPTSPLVKKLAHLGNNCQDLPMSTTQRLCCGLASVPRCQG